MKKNFALNKIQQRHRYRSNGSNAERESNLGRKTVVRTDKQRAERKKEKMFAKTNQLPKNVRSLD